MEHRTLGRTGVKVAPLSFGTDNFMSPTLERECTRMLLTAMDAGVNLLDTGDVYADGEGERVIGRILKDSGRRHEILIGTKVDHSSRPGAPNERGHSRLNIIRACEASLKRLQTEYIDLYQPHRPSPDIPFDETLGAARDGAAAVQLTGPSHRERTRPDGPTVGPRSNHLGAHGPRNARRSILVEHRIPGRFPSRPARQLLRRSNHCAGHRDGARLRRSGVRGRAAIRPTGCPLVQRPARRDEPVDRPADYGAPRVAASSDGHGAERRPASRLRRARSTGQRRRRLPQHVRLDEDHDGRVTAESNCPFAVSGLAVCVWWRAESSSRVSDHDYPFGVSALVVRSW